MKQILNADGAASDLVLVSGANTASGSADLSRPFGAFSCAVQSRMVWQDQRTRFADRQSAAKVQAGPFEGHALVQQRLRRHHDTVADVACYPAAQYSRRDQVQNGFLAPDNQGVA